MAHARVPLPVNSSMSSSSSSVVSFAPYETDNLRHAIEELCTPGSKRVNLIEVAPGCSGFRASFESAPPPGAPPAPLRKRAVLSGPYDCIYNRMT